MREIMRCNDLIRLSFLRALLKDAGIHSEVADQHASAVQGSLGILPRRLMVTEDCYDLALEVLGEAGEIEGAPEPRE
jgi:hypothetical protein